MTTVDIVREFIISELHWDDSRAPLTPDFSLIEHGAVDSLGIFMLVTFVEERFGVEVRDDEIIPENFGSLGAIAEYVERKRRS